MAAAQPVLIAKPPFGSAAGHDRRIAKMAIPGGKDRRRPVAFPFLRSHFIGSSERAAQHQHGVVPPTGPVVMDLTILQRVADLEELIALESNGRTVQELVLESRARVAAEIAAETPAPADGSVPAAAPHAAFTGAGRPPKPPAPPSRGVAAGHPGEPPQPGKGKVPKPPAPPSRK